MKTRDFASPTEARREAARASYWPRHRHDGVDVWRRDDGKEIALAREERARSTVWHWVEPPPDQSGEPKLELQKTLDLV